MPGGDLTPRGSRRGIQGDVLHQPRSQLRPQRSLDNRLPSSSMDGTLPTQQQQKQVDPHHAHVHPHQPHQQGGLNQYATNNNVTNTHLQDNALSSATTLAHSNVNAHMPQQMVQNPSDPYHQLHHLQHQQQHQQQQQQQPSELQQLQQALHAQQGQSGQGQGQQNMFGGTTDGGQMIDPMRQSSIQQSQQQQQQVRGVMGRLRRGDFL